MDVKLELKKIEDFEKNLKSAITIGNESDYCKIMNLELEKTFSFIEGEKEKLFNDYIDFELRRIQEKRKKFVDCHSYRRRLLDYDNKTKVLYLFNDQFRILYDFSEIDDYNARIDIFMKNIKEWEELVYSISNKYYDNVYIYRKMFNEIKNELKDVFNLVGFELLNFTNIYYHDIEGLLEVKFTYLGKSFYTDKISVRDFEIDFEDEKLKYLELIRKSLLEQNNSIRQDFYRNKSYEICEKIRKIAPRIKKIDIKDPRYNKKMEIKFFDVNELYISSDFNINDEENIDKLIKSISSNLNKILKLDCDYIRNIKNVSNIKIGDYYYFHKMAELEVAGHIYTYAIVKGITTKHKNRYYVDGVLVTSGRERRKIKKLLNL